MKKVNVRKLALAGILVAVGIVCSPLSVPIGASKCAPVQHFINILGGVFLGPGYAVGMAFVTSLLRNLMGTGTLLAFPGSMCGRFCAACCISTGSISLCLCGRAVRDIRDRRASELSGCNADHGERERSIRLCHSILRIQLRRYGHCGHTGNGDEEDESV